MAILIDPPMWPAHGTLWSHLVSDTSYDELHHFASQLRLPRRGFDLDHYDVPASLHRHAVDLGAQPVDPRVVVRALQRSGLRVRSADRHAERPPRRRQFLLQEWSALTHVTDITSSDTHRWAALGHQLIARWNEPHRSYHDERHLEDVLLALNHLEVRGEVISPATMLAAWFHDAVYNGDSGSDERDSAKLAVTELACFDLASPLLSQVEALIHGTTPGAAPLVNSTDPHLFDADLAIFAASSARYAEYAAAVRLEYAHVAEPDFRAGRAEILHGYLNRPSIYRTSTARELWEERARVNLTNEITSLPSSRLPATPQ